MKNITSHSHRIENSDDSNRAWVMQPLAELRENLVLKPDRILIILTTTGQLHSGDLGRNNLSHCVMYSYYYLVESFKRFAYVVHIFSPI